MKLFYTIETNFSEEAFKGVEFNKPKDALDMCARICEAHPERKLVFTVKGYNLLTGRLELSAVVSNKHTQFKFHENADEFYEED